MTDSPVINVLSFSSSVRCRHSSTGTDCELPPGTLSSLRYAFLLCKHFSVFPPVRCRSLRRHIRVIVILEAQRGILLEAPKWNETFMSSRATHKIETSFSLAERQEACLISDSHGALFLELPTVIPASPKTVFRESECFQSKN